MSLTAGAALVTDSMSAPVRHALVACGVVAAAVALLLWLAWRMAPMAASSDPGQHVPMAEAVLVMGQGRATADGVLLERFNDEGEAFVVWRPEPFDSAALPVLTYRIDGLPLNHVVMLAWRGEGDADARFVRLQSPDGSSQSELLARHASWQGRIVELALYMYPHPQTSAPRPFDGEVVVRELAVHPDGLLRRLEVLATHWFAADPWNMMSISSLGIYRDLPEPQPLLPVVAALSLLAWLGWLAAAGAKSTREVVRRALVVTLVATVFLQVLSLRNLVRQRSATEAVYGQLDPSEWSAQLFDAPLTAMIEEVKARIPPPGSVRIFAASDDRFFRLRMAWHLRPHNVLSGLPGENLRGVAALRFLRPGDLIVAWRRPDLVAQAAQGGLQIRGQRVPVRLRFRQDDGGLFEIVAEEPPE